jgi:small-conductance mechanosensitive channel
MPELRGAFTDLLTWAIPLAATLLMVLLALWAVRRTFADTAKSRLTRHLSQIVILLLANVLLVLVMPFSDSLRGQLLSLFGLVLTAVIALSSTTFVSNAMAGLMLRAVRNFQVGDYIRVGEQFGRVSERGLLHTELQNQQRDLVTLPNLYLMNQPVQVVRKTGTLIRADISLGYDVHSAQAVKLLKAAAESAELSEPFVQVTELGNYAVGYSVSGLLEDLDQLISARTRLYTQILQAFHDAGVEIVSPAFMSQRQLLQGQKIIPQGSLHTADPGAGEAVMFEKAELRAQLHELAERRAALLANIESHAAAKDAMEHSAEIDQMRRELGYLDLILKREQAAGEKSEH